MQKLVWEIDRKDLTTGWFRLSCICDLIPGRNPGADAKLQSARAIKTK